MFEQKQLVFGSGLFNVSAY